MTRPTAKIGISRCECGARLPTHLAEFADNRFSHICSCERRYRVVDGKFVRNGTEANPFVAYDRVHGRNRR